MLPELPDTFFGWIPALYKISEEEVLASAGLDAYVVSSQPLRIQIRMIERATVPLFLSNGN